MGDELMNTQGFFRQGAARIIGGPTRLMKLGATGLKPGFAFITNPEQSHTTKRDRKPK